MATKKLTKAMLIAAHNEIDGAVGIEPPIKEDLKQEKYEKELFDTIIDLDLSKTEISGFEKGTQEVIKALKEKFAKVVADEDEEDEEEEEVEVAKPAPVKKGAKKPEPVVEEEEEEEEEEEADEEEEEEVAPPPAKKGKAAPAKKAAKKPVVVEEEDEDEDDEEEEEIPVAPPVKKGKKAAVVEKDDEDEDEEKPAKVKKAKKEKDTRPGVIAFIAKCIEDAGPKGVAKEEIFAKLVKLYPERQESSMTVTLNAQISNRMSGVYWPIGQTKSGKYFKK